MNEMTFINSFEYFTKITESEFVIRMPLEHATIFLLELEMSGVEIIYDWRINNFFGSRDLEGKKEICILFIKMNRGYDILRRPWPYGDGDGSSWSGKNHYNLNKALRSEKLSKILSN